MSCSSCGTANAAGNKFCLQCGAVLAQSPTCRACGTSLAPGAKFCTSCGTTVAAAPEIPQGPGYVVDGEWHRAPGELVRKVPGDALRSAFGRLVPGVDWPAFLRGSLAGKVVDALLSRSVRIPMGSVGVVTRDGVCVRILPPGEQTSPGLLRELVAGELGAGAVLEKVLGAERVSLYLVDRRPVPLSFTVETPAAGSAGTRTLQATALVSVGADRDSLGAFLNEVVGDRETLSAEDLYLRFRSEIERAVADAVRARPTDVPGAEKVARDALRARFAARTGLTFDLVLAPRHTVHRLDLLLADGLLTADGARVEVDVVLSVQGDEIPSPPTGILQATAARHLRARPWADVPTSEGLAALESALSEAGGDALRALGYRLLSLELVDVRSAGQQWELGSRAAIEQARAEVRAGREWLSVRDDEQALDALTATSSLKAERLRRDSTFAGRELALEDARRVAALEAEERGLARNRAEAEHRDALAGDARAHERIDQAAKDRAALERQRMSTESEQRRIQAEDEAHVERLRREARLAELGALAEIEARIAAQEQQHRVETMSKLAGQTEGQMIAMQAADLANKEHGGAFAEALGKLADGEAARRERERTDRVTTEAMKAMQDLARASIEASAKVGAAKAAASCSHCGATLKPGARFCAECGTGLA